MNIFGSKKWFYMSISLLAIIAIALVIKNKKAEHFAGIMSPTIVIDKHIKSPSAGTNPSDNSNSSDSSVFLHGSRKSFPKDVVDWQSAFEYAHNQAPLVQRATLLCDLAAYAGKIENQEFLKRLLDQEPSELRKQALREYINATNSSVILHDFIANGLSKLSEEEKSYIMPNLRGVLKRLSREDLENVMLSGSMSPDVSKAVSSAYGSSLAKTDKLGDNLSAIENNFLGSKENQNAATYSYYEQMTDTNLNFVKESIITGKVSPEILNSLSYIVVNRMLLHETPQKAVNFVGNLDDTALQSKLSLNIYRDWAGISAKEASEHALSLKEGPILRGAAQAMYEIAIKDKQYDVAEKWQLLTK